MAGREVIQKITIPAIIQTMTQQIRGQIYVREWERVKGMLDMPNEQFIAVTDAEVLNTRGEVVHRAEFLAVNKQHILWLDPNEPKA
jgi:chemotaxis protein histidine kinase CheA